MAKKPPTVTSGEIRALFDQIAEKSVVVRRKPLVYIASPYTAGDVAQNVAFQMLVFNYLLDSGVIAPYAPLWSHFQHVVHPRSYEEWMRYDEEIIVHCDACIRLAAHNPSNDYEMVTSPGADREVEMFRAQGKPVFYETTDVIQWAKDQMR